MKPYQDLFFFYPLKHHNIKGFDLTLVHKLDNLNIQS